MLETIAPLISEFHFIRPLWFVLLVPVLAICVDLWQYQRKSSTWQSIVAPHLLPFLMDGETTRVSRYPLVGLVALWLSLIIALAGPTFSKIPQPVHQKTSALVIAWDMSPSMMAQDVKPSRLVRSRLKLIDLLRARTEGQTALIAYSGQAHVVTPLTDDTETIISLVKGLNPRVMPSQGSNTEMAHEMASQLLKDGGIAKGDILFVTDGIAPSAQIALAQIHDSAPHSISIWGFGTEEGAPIPLANGGFAYDRNGEMVIANLDEHALSTTASALGGVYIPFSQTDFDLLTIKSFILNPLTDATHEVEDRRFDQWLELGPYMLVILLPFAALAFRRGWLLCFCLFFVVGSPQKVYAFGWQDLWQTKNQQAQKLLKEQPEVAAETFTRKDWKAIAHYKAGNYQQALEQFKGDSAHSFYNQGNAHTQLGNYDDAIHSFKKALELNPGLNAAHQNLAIAEQLKKLKEQQQENSDGEPQEGNEQGDENTGENESDSNSQQNPNNSDANQNAKGDNNSKQEDQQPGEDNQQQAETNEPNESGADQPEEGSEEQHSDSQSDAMTEQQKQALEDAYGEKQDDELEGESEDENQSVSKQSSDTETKTDEDAMATGDEQNDSETDDSPANSSIIQPEISREQNEAEQSLEQWLRKVPDNPSKLLENKFRYEHRQRKRALRQNNWQLPNETADEERW